MKEGLHHYGALFESAFDKLSYFLSRIASMRIFASSGRVYSGGGAWPARKSSRTLVPDSSRRSSSACGQVLKDAMDSHFLQKKVFSKFSVVIPISSGLKLSKIFCASYV